MIKKRHIIPKLKSDNCSLRNGLKRLPSSVTNASERSCIEREHKRRRGKKEASSKHPGDSFDILLLATKKAGIGIWEYLIQENRFIGDDFLLSIYGKTRGESLGNYECWLQNIHPGDKERVSREFENTLTNHADFEVEFRNVWPDGSVHFIKGVAVVQKDRSGKPIRLIGTNQDITKVKATERLLGGSEFKFVEAQSVAKVGSWEADLSGLNVQWSSETSQIFGMAPAESNASYQNCLDLIHPDDLVKVNAAFADSLDTRTLNTIRHRIVTPSGKIKTVEERWHIDRDHRGTPSRARGTIEDITERIQSDPLIIESEAKYRAFCETSTDGILLTITDGDIISANPAACQIFNMTEEEICAAGRFALADVTDPRLRPLLEERQRTGRVRGELTLVRKNGEKFPAELTSAIFKDNSGQEKTSMIIRDLTDRKEAEERDIFQAKLLNTIGQAVISTDLSGNINYWNKAAEAMYGWVAEEVTGKNISLLVPASQSEQELNEIFEQLDQGKSWSGEFDVQRKDGTVFPAFVTDSPIYDQHNQLAGIIGISTDITERRKADAAICESEAFNRGVIDSMSAHIAVIDESGTIIKVNKTWETFAINNGSPSVHKCGVGTNYFDACTNASDASDTTPALAMDGIKKVLDGRLGELYLEYPCHSPTEERWFFMRVRRFESSQPLALIKHQYITERKQAEEKVIETTNTLQQTLNDMNTIMDSSLDIICTIDETGTFSKVSAASEHILGYKPGELKGRKFIDFVFSEDVEITIAAAKGVMGGAPVTVFENRYVNKSGKIVPMLWSAKWDGNDNLLYCVAKDATEKKRLEKALKDERQQFHDLFMEAPTSMGILKGPDHVYEVANPLYLHLLGKKDIVGKPVKEVAPEVKDQGFIAILDEVYRTGRTFVAKEMLIKLDKGGNGILVDHYLNFIYQAYRNVEGVIEGILFFAVDVTEQVFSRNQIEASEKRYRQIVETAQEGIWLIDANNTTTFVNNKLCEIFQYSQEEMMGKDIYYFMDDEGKRIAEDLMKKKKEGVSDHVQHKYISKSGSAIWTNISANPLFTEDGIYDGALAMITDITDRRNMEYKLAHSESTLKEAQTLAYIGNWEIDLLSNTQLWSDELYKILGLSKENDAPSTELYFSLIHPDDVNFVREEISKSYETLTGTPFEYRLMAADNSIKYLYTQSRFELNENNAPLRIYGIVQDISQRKLAEMERTKMVKDLVQRNKELEQFTYIVSHNLRAPIANIMGFAEALADKTYPESLQVEFLSQLSVSVSKLDDVTRDLNNVLLIKQKVNDVKTVINLSTIVENIKISIQNLIEQYNVTIETDFKEVESILSIKTFLHSILYNLISNSIKYRSPDKAPVISIRTRKMPEGVELIFSDNGLGIDMKKNHDKVFGLYKRFHFNIEGKGLGLFMTKSQIETLGGTIEVSSEINNGATFKIYLPYSTTPL